MATSPHVSLAHWDENGLALLRRGNTPEQKLHIGGPESEEKLVDRQRRYVTGTRPGWTQMFRIICDGEETGSIGYWEHEHDGMTIYETGWEVLPGFHGRGIGKTAATLVITELKKVARHRWLHAFPSPDNAPSNAMCRALGFELLGPREFEFPKGQWMISNDWRLDLGVAD